MNFIPTQGSEQDTDIYRLWVKIGIEYTCETLNLSAFADTNIILWDQNGNPFNPWIGNDDREDTTGDTPDFSSKVTYLATYTGWLHIIVGPVNPPALDEADLHTYDLTCSSSAATATPTPTATFPHYHHQQVVQVVHQPQVRQRLRQRPLFSQPSRRQPPLLNCPRQHPHPHRLLFSSNHCPQLHHFLAEGKM